MLTPSFNNFLSSLAGAPTLSGSFVAGPPQAPAASGLAPSGEGEGGEGGEGFAQQLALLLAALPVAEGQAPPGQGSPAKTASLVRGLAQILELLQTPEGARPPQGVREWLKSLLAEGPAQWPGREQLQEQLEAGEANDPGALLEAVAACLPQTFAKAPAAAAQTSPGTALEAAPVVVLDTPAPQGQQPSAARPPSLTDVPGGAPRPWRPAEQPPGSEAPEQPSPPQAAAGPAPAAVAAPEAGTAEGEGQGAPAAGPGSEAAQVGAPPQEELSEDDDPLGREVARAVREAIERVKAVGTPAPAGPEVAQAAHEVLSAHTRWPQAKGSRQGTSQTAPRPQAVPPAESPISEAEAALQSIVPAKEPAANLNQDLAGVLGQAEGTQAALAEGEPSGRSARRPVVSLEAVQARLAAEADQGLARPDAAPRPEPAPELVRQVATQVARALQQGVQQGAERLRLRLKPPELGELHLDLKLRGADLRVTLVAETGAAREALQAGMAELRGSLAEQGLRLEECHVFVRQDGAGAFAFQGREHSGQQQVQNPPPGTAAGGPPEPGAELTASQPRGRIDLFC